MRLQRRLRGVRRIGDQRLAIKHLEALVEGAPEQAAYILLLAETRASIGKGYNAATARKLFSRFLKATKDSSVRREFELLALLRWFGHAADELEAVRARTKSLSKRVKPGKRGLLAQADQGELRRLVPKIDKDVKKWQKSHDKQAPRTARAERRVGEARADYDRANGPQRPRRRANFDSKVANLWEKYQDAQRLFGKSSKRLAKIDETLKAAEERLRAHQARLEAYVPIDD